MTKDEFLEKLESLLEFNCRSLVCMHSYDLIVMSSKLFFDFCVSDSGMQGRIPYSEIIDVELVDDHIKGLYLYLGTISEELYIPASGFHIKSKAPVRSVELYQYYRRAWVVRELKKQRVVMVFASFKEEAVYMALCYFKFDDNDILEDRIPYTVEIAPTDNAWCAVITDKNYLDPAIKEDWEILKQSGFYRNDEGFIKYSFWD